MTSSTAWISIQSPRTGWLNYPPAVVRAAVRASSVHCALAVGVSSPAQQASLISGAAPSASASSNGSLSNGSFTSPAPVDRTAAFLGQAVPLAGVAVDNVFASNAAAGLGPSQRSRLLGTNARDVSSTVAQLPAKVQQAVADHASELEDDLLEALAVSRGVR